MRSLHTLIALSNPSELVYDRLIVCLLNDASFAWVSSDHFVVLLTSEHTHFQCSITCTILVIIESRTQRPITYHTLHTPTTLCFIFTNTLTLCSPYQPLSVPVAAPFFSLETVSSYSSSTQYPCLCYHTNHCLSPHSTPHLHTHNQHTHLPCFYPLPYPHVCLFIAGVEDDILFFTTIHSFREHHA